MPRKPKTPTLALPLSVEGAPRPAPSASAVVEFVNLSENKPWRIEKWEALTAEFHGLTRDRLPEWELCMSRSSRRHTIVRRLFGMGPVIIPLSADPDDFRAMSPDDLCEFLRIDRQALSAEMEEARRQWKGMAAKDQDGYSPKSRPDGKDPDEDLIEDGAKTASVAESKPPSAQAPEISHGDDETLRLAGFAPERMFHHDTAWKPRFVDRVREWGPILRDRMTATTARSALLNELRVWRLEQCLMEEDPAARDKESRKRYRELADELDTVNRAYQGQLQLIEQQAPWFNVTGQTLSFKNAISELVQGLQEYHANGNTEKLDGIFTATEIQVLLRTSSQSPEPTYRMGWVTHVNSSREWLYRQEARRQFKASDLAKLDAGFKAAVRAYVEDSGEHVPDLEREGADGEYEDIFQPQAGVGTEEKPNAKDSK